MSNEINSTTGSPSSDSNGSDLPTNEEQEAKASGIFRHSKLAGTKLGHFLLVRELGHGGQGFVWLAEDTALKRKVALKLLTRHTALSEKARMRFLREAEVASKLNHPGICGIHEVGETDDLPWISMQLIEGKPLDRAIAESKSEFGDQSNPSHLDFETNAEAEKSTASKTEYSANGNSTGITPKRDKVVKIVRLIESAARALHVAHEASLVHRDIKPGNMMVTQDGRAVILDFGLAYDEGAAAVTLTQSGEILGTPAYMSPEQVAGSRMGIDRRTDIYSLGATLYECLSLCRPFTAPSCQALYRKISFEEPANLRGLNPAIPKDLAVVVASAMSKNPSDRYSTALDFAEDLRRVCEYEPIMAKPANPVVKLQRWAQRNRVLAASIVAVMIVTAVAFALVLESRNEERATKDRALKLASDNLILAKDERAARTQAEADAESAKRIQAFLLGLFQESDPIAFHGRAFGFRSQSTDVLTAQDILDRGAAKLKTELTDKPIVRANLLDAIGSVYVFLGATDQGELLIREAAEIRAELLDEGHVDRVASGMSLAFLNISKGEKCADDLIRVLAMQKKAHGEKSYEAMRTAALLAIQLSFEDRADEAFEYVEFALAIGESSSIKGSYEIALTRLIYAHLCFSRQRDQEGFAEVKKAAKIIDNLEGNQDFSKLIALYMQAEMATRLKQPQAAGKYYEETLRLSEKLLGPDHFLVAIVLSSYGACLMRIKADRELGATLMERAIVLKRKNFGENSYTIPGSLVALARCRRAQNRNDEAIKLLLEVLKIAENNSRVPASMIASAHHILAVEYRRKKLYAKAEDSLAKVLDIRLTEGSKNTKRLMLAARNWEIFLLERHGQSGPIPVLTAKDDHSIEQTFGRALSHARALALLDKTDLKGNILSWVSEYLATQAMKSLAESLELGLDPVRANTLPGIELFKKRSDFPIP